MTGREIVKEIGTNQNSDQPFIKWCRKENDFVDYELVDKFMANAGTSDEYASYELLTMEQMWEIVKKIDPKGVSRGEKEGAEVIFWDQKRSDGTTTSRICPFTPDSLISIVDVTTRGNPVD